MPTIVNRAWGKSFFWDGRIATLEEQVLQPILAELEMDLSIEEAVERLRVRSPYPAAFRDTIGRDVNRDDLARALAAYVRTIQSGASPYDRYVWGEPDALSQDAQAGLRPLQLPLEPAVLHRELLHPRVDGPRCRPPAAPTHLSQGARFALPPPVRQQRRVQPLATQQGTHLAGPLARVGCV